MCLAVHTEDPADGYPPQQDAPSITPNPSRPRDSYWPPRAIAVLARAQQDALWERTYAHNKLRSLLREYYPVVMAAFTDKRGGILRPEACGAGREGLAHVSSGPV